MRYIRPQQPLKPESYPVLSKLKEAKEKLDSIPESNKDLNQSLEELMYLSKQAEAALDKLALEDPEEATRALIKSGYYPMKIHWDELYIGNGILITRAELSEYGLNSKDARLRFLMQRGSKYLP